MVFDRTDIAMDKLVFLIVCLVLTIECAGVLTYSI